MAKGNKIAKDRNVDCDCTKLDADVRAAAGTLYNRSVISTFIMGKSAGYYYHMMERQKIAETSLNKVCKYYHLNKSDYIITKPKLELVKSEVPANDIEGNEVEKASEDPTQEPAVEVNIDINSVLEKLTEITTQLADATKAITKITSVLGTCYAEEKSISYLISQLHDKMSQHCKNEKDILEKLEQNTRYKKNNGSRRIG